MAVTITNTSKLTALALISVNNPVPFTLTVESAFEPTVTVVIKKGSSSGEVIAEIELLCYKRSNPYYYFVADLSKILKSTFKNLDDVVQSENVWIDMEDMLEDFRIEVTATNDLGETANFATTITCINNSRQLGNSTEYREKLLGVYDNAEETYYGGSNNVVYIYQLSLLEDDIDIHEEEPTGILVDGDEVVLGDNSNNILIDND